VSRLYRVSKVFRLLKIAKIATQFEQLNDLIEQVNMHAAYLRMLKLFLLVSFFVHLAGCMWFFNSSLLDSSQTWIQLNDFQDETPIYQYFVSIYWATQTVTTVGYGDIAIGCQNEYVFAIGTMCIGASLYTYLVSSISQIIQHFDAEAFRTKDQIEVLQRLQKRIGLLPDTALRI
jgi:hypothetical protein